MESGRRSRETGNSILLLLIGEMDSRNPLRADLLGWVAAMKNFKISEAIACNDALEEAISANFVKGVANGIFDKHATMVVDLQQNAPSFGVLQMMHWAPLVEGKSYNNNNSTGPGKTIFSLFLVYLNKSQNITIIIHIFSFLHFNRTRTFVRWP